MNKCIRHKSERENNHRILWCTTNCKNCAIFYIFHFKLHSHILQESSLCIEKERKQRQKKACGKKYGELNRDQGMFLGQKEIMFSQYPHSC